MDSARTSGALSQAYFSQVISRRAIFESTRDK